MIRGHRFRGVRLTHPNPAAVVQKPDSEELHFRLSERVVERFSLACGAVAVIADVNPPALERDEDPIEPRPTRPFEPAFRPQRAVPRVSRAVGPVRRSLTPRLRPLASSTIDHEQAVFRKQEIRNDNRNATNASTEVCNSIAGVQDADRVKKGRRLILRNQRRLETLQVSLLEGIIWREFKSGRDRLRITREQWNQ